MIELANEVRKELEILGNLVPKDKKKLVVPTPQLPISAHMPISALRLQPWPELVASDS